MGQKMHIYFVRKSSYQQTFMLLFKNTYWFMTTPQFYQLPLFGTFDEFYHSKYLLKIVPIADYFCVVSMLICKYFFLLQNTQKKLLLLFYKVLYRNNIIYTFPCIIKTRSSFSKLLRSCSKLQIKKFQNLPKIR